MLPHYVYLAHFGSGIIKVGIAYKPRLMARLKEQGARMAIVVNEYKNAYEAREVEEKITTEIKIADGLSTKRKMDLLS